MGNSNNTILQQQKYNREFNKDDINDKSKFDLQELYSQLHVTKGGSDQFTMIDKGVQVIKNSDNATLKINGLNNVVITENGTKFDFTTSYQYPLRKYCVKIDGVKEYCSCDTSIIDLSMDITRLKSKL